MCPLPSHYDQIIHWSLGKGGCEGGNGEEERKKEEETEGDGKRKRGRESKGSSNNS